MNFKIKHLLIYILTLAVLITAVPQYTFAEPDDTATTDTDDETDLEDETDEDEDDEDTSYVSSSDSWPAGPSIKGKTAVVIDADTGAILYEKKKDKQMYPASITKILTCLLTLENCQMDEKVTMSHYAVYSVPYGGAHIGLKEGETISVEDCLYALMLASANEVAFGLAEHISGSVEKFANLMNERAKQLGATNTHFVNPNGLPDEEHYTTAYDMALITKAALSCKDFETIIGTKMYVIDKTKMTDEKRYATNFHRMIYEDNTEYYEGIVGGKTGYTEESGNTLVTVARRDGRTLICVVLNSKKIYPDTTKLLDFGFDKFKSVAIDEEKITVETGVNYNRLMQLYGDGEMKLLYPNGNTLTIPANADESEITYELTTKEDTDTSSNNTSDTTDSETNSSTTDSENTSSTSAISEEDAKYVVAAIKFYYDSKEIGSCDVYYKPYKNESDTDAKKDKGLFSTFKKKNNSSFFNSSLMKAIKLIGLIFIIIMVILALLALRVAIINAKRKKQRLERQRRRMERAKRLERAQQEEYRREREYRTGHHHHDQN